MPRLLPLVAVVLAATAFAAPPSPQDQPMANSPIPPPTPREKTPPMAPARLEQVKRELAQVVAKHAGPNAQIDTRQEEGPLGLWVVTAAQQHAYPGSGVARVLIDAAGVTYGVHGDEDLADLVRARGWLASGAPKPATLVKLVDLAFFEGVALLMDQPAPKVERAGGALKLTFYRTWHPSGGKTRVEVTFGPTGKAALTSTNED